MRTELIRAAVLGALATLTLAGPASAQRAFEREKYGDPNALATVVFDFGRSDLTDEAKARLDHAVVLAGGSALEVVGHTDHSGDAAYNQWLAEQRAQAVRQYLIAKGIARDKVTIVAAGAADPVDTNHSKLGRARNRRVDVRPAK